jgi:general secretion pathway protein A
VLVGDAGTGKTTLCRHLAAHLGRRVVIALVEEPVVAFDDLVKKSLVRLGLVSSEDLVAAGPELESAVGDFAASLATLHASVAIVVDEAQNLAPEILERLVAWADRANDARRVQIVLVGQPRLSTLVDGLADVRRRVGARCRLDPLEPEETAGYVIHQLASADPGARVEFDAGALGEIHRRTEGVLRLINLLCDRALTRADELSANVIGAAIVADAAIDVGLELPAPPPEAPRRAADRALRLLAFVGLVLVGAAAAWLFRDGVMRLIDSLR